MINSHIVICLFAFVVQSYARSPPSEAEQEDVLLVRCKLADKLTDALVVGEAIKPTDLTGDLVNTTLGQVGQFTALSIPRLHVRRTFPAYPAVLPERPQRFPDSVTTVDTELFRSSASKLSRAIRGADRKVIATAVDPERIMEELNRDWDELTETTWKPMPIVTETTHWKPTPPPNTTVHILRSNFGTTTYTTTETPEFDETKDGNPWWHPGGPDPNSYYAKDNKFALDKAEEFIEGLGGKEFLQSKQGQIELGKQMLEETKEREQIDLEKGGSNNPFAKLFSAIRVQLTRFKMWQNQLPRVKQTWVRILIVFALIIGWLAFGINFRYMPNPVDEIPFYG